MRYSVWNAPSLDDDLGNTLFGRQNRQILLFCVGFIFPLGTLSPRTHPMHEREYTDAHISMDARIFPSFAARPKARGRSEPDRSRAAVCTELWGRG
jgi:hypothetical protein